MFSNIDAENSDEIDNDTINKSFEYLEKRFQLENKDKVLQRRDKEKFLVFKVPIEVDEFLDQTTLDKLRDYLNKNSIMIRVGAFIIGILTFVLCFK
ncbi:hypothetical protein KAU33_04295 [Candidatus Dependentiae bacterium]|nr:hypothetical protein [Candidatus Dependentiae bacterium]